MGLIFFFLIRFFYAKFYSTLCAAIVSLSQRLTSNNGGADEAKNQVTNLTMR